MNLTQLLNYRTQCFIHQLPMEMRFVSTNELDKSVIVGHKNEHGELVLSMRNCEAPGGATFKADGKLIIDRGHDAVRRIIKAPVLVVMKCKECKNINNKEDIAIQDIGISTHSYHFRLCSWEHKDILRRVPIQGDYDCVPGKEFIKYSHNGKFYHLTANISGGEASLGMCKCDKNDTLDQILKSAEQWKLFNFNPSTIRNLQHLVEKIEVYNLFS